MSNALHTERLILSAPGLQDLKQFAPLLGEYAVAKNLLTAPHPYTEDHGRALILSAARGWVTGEDWVFAIRLKDARACIGICGVNRRSWEIGYWLGQPYWCQGFATEAVSALIGFAFDKGAPRINARWFHDNPASGHVLKKLGFRHTGIECAHSLARGTKVRTHAMALNRAAHAGERLAA